jgi:P4 family phage/plasmid primase-like protien
MSENENPASGGTLDGANSNFAGCDGGISSTSQPATQNTHGNTPENPTMIAAVALAARGWLTFPADVANKKSMKAGKRDANGKWLTERWGATKEEAEIRTNYRQWPGAGIGIPTGPTNGIFVIEADTPKGHGGANGNVSLEAMQAVYGEPFSPTLMARSPSGSMHYYFKWPDGMTVKNSVSIIGPAVDVRGEGGMVIAPPSRKPSGVYEWVNWGTGVADAPAWLLRLVAAPKAVELPISVQAAALIRKPVPITGSLEAKRMAGWLTAAFNDEVAMVAGTAKGGRNGQLFKSTANLAGYIKSGANLSRTDVEDAMITAATTNGEVADGGIGEVKETIKSAFAKAEPRPLPDFSASINDVPEREQELAIRYQVDGEHPEGGGGTGNDTKPPEADAPMYSEIHLANHFVDRHEKNLRFVAKWGSWMIWDSIRWQFDHTMRAFDLARAICREAAKQCALHTDKPSEPKALASAKTVAAVEKLARAYRTLAAVTDQWDVQPYLFNDTVATVNLKTGEAQTPDRANYITQQAGCAAAPSGIPHPIWSAFLTKITAGDKELEAFLQRYVGYCLTGDISEHCFAFGYGTGANGKGVFLNTIAKIFGEYATVADMATFIESKSDRHPTELAKLRGSRLVVAQETQQGRAWDEAKIKAITGGDKQTARFMRQDFFDFYPTFKLFICGNHKPTLRNVDEAMKRRLLLIPFTVSIPVAERDPQLTEKLEAEWPAILRWAIDGCLAWRQKGLVPPKAVTDATAAYFADEDSFSQWLEDCCDVEIGNIFKWATSAELFGSWTAYATKTGNPTGTAKAFSELLINRGFEQVRKGKGRDRAYDGIQLKPQAAGWNETADERD